ncbi:MAG: type II toxin-antitoxin system RelE/ParE family toxin [Candidatus Babeliales bacterium]
MKKWQVKFWETPGSQSPIEKWLDKLTKEQFKAISKELRMLGFAGNTLRLPHSKALGQGLFELREYKFGYRMYYGFQGNCIIIVLAAGDKSSQERDIRIARDRLLEV